MAENSPSSARWAAERELELHRPGLPPSVVIARLGVPEPDPMPGGDWMCRLDIEGLQGATVMEHAFGADPMQALYLGLQLLGVALAHGVPSGARLTWLGDDDLGFPPLDGDTSAIPGFMEDGSLDDE